MPFRRESWGHNEIARWAYIAIVTISAIVMAVLFVMIRNDRNSLNREANIRATQIQQQRYDATFEGCTDQNLRHDHTIHRLEVILQRYIKKHPESRAQAAASVKQNEFLIDALVPKRNCKVVAKNAVHPLENPKGR